MNRLLVILLITFTLNSYASITSSLIQLAIPVANLLDKREGTKYQDKILSIEKELQNEELKNTPDDGRIGYLHLELMRLTGVLANTLKPKTP
jgi:hypothetical protein